MKYNIIENECGDYELVSIDSNLEDVEVMMKGIEMSDEDISAFNDDPKRFMLNKDCWQLLCEETEEEWCERTGEKTTEDLLGEGYSWNAIR